MGPIVFDFVIVAETASVEAGEEDAYVIAPHAAFAEPVKVLVPVAAGLDPASLTVYYRLGESGWVPGTALAGWLLDEHVEYVDGKAHVALTVRHGGEVRLAPRAVASAAGILPMAGRYGDAVLVALLLVAMAGARRFKTLRG